jgi:hypothetical protein
MKRLLVTTAIITCIASPALAGVESSVDHAISGLLLIGLILSGYFLPTIVAFYRGHDNRVGIMLLNLLLGWTCLGWIGALIWSVLSMTTRERVIYIDKP